MIGERTKMVGWGGIRIEMMTDVWPAGGHMLVTREEIVGAGQTAVHIVIGKHEGGAGGNSIVSVEDVHHPD